MAEELYQRQRLEGCWRLAASLRWVTTLACLLLAQHVRSTAPPPLSSHECVEAGHEDHRVCIFRDVFYWHARMYYVANDTNLVLPRVSVRFGAIVPNSAYLDPLIVRPSDVQLQNAEMITLGGDGEDVYLWSTLPENNWFHHAGEYMPTLSNTLCKYLGRCYYNQTQGLRLLEIFPNLGDFPWAGWLNELHKCYTPYPKVSVWDKDMFEKIIYLKKVLVGVGPECRARMFCSNDPSFSSRRPVSPEGLHLHRRRLAECLDYNDTRTASIDPINMVVIDRHYTSARHILNIGQIMELLRERYGSIAKISLEYVEGMGAKEQVQLWAAADIVIHVHGATQGSWMFLPKQATVVHIVQHPNGILHDNSYADQWVSDLREVTNVTYFPVNNTDMTFAHMKQEVVWKQPQWQGLSPEAKLSILETGNCDILPDDSSRGHCRMWWLHKNLNLVMRPELLLPQVDAAVMDLYSKLGRLLPPGFPPEPYSEERRRHRRQVRSRKLLDLLRVMMGRRR